MLRREGESGNKKINKNIYKSTKISWRRTKKGYRRKTN
jgi:hypothetical protein